LTFKPYQLVGHFVQLIAQRADKLGGLGGIAFIHGESIARLALSQTSEMAAAVHNPLNETKTPGHRGEDQGGPNYCSNAEMADLVPRSSCRGAATSHLTWNRAGRIGGMIPGRIGADPINYKDTE
jgi:hypothetical protein